MQLANRTAVVTGAASGIGRGLAQALAKRRCHLALADLNEVGLQRTAELVTTPGLRISCHRLDVADAEAVASFPQVVRASHPGVDLLFNNAGVALGGTFEQVSDDDFEWLFGINFRGVVRMTRAFLPLLKASADARIVNLSSVFGLMGVPGQTAYAASKFAVRGFSESLRLELEGSNVGVTVVHPGGVATSIADNARMPVGTSAEEVERGRAFMRKVLKLPPEVAGETIVQGVERRKARVLVGRDAHVIAWIVRVAPVSYWRLITPLLPR
ncbi:MAG TPA: SDR family NAD(P)-dependent oxidoreductase [Anaerolineae bacterium]|nr:SDR family NAD(P)-dependent oxidoreductase [Anaerolineae bacterium]